LLFIAFTILLFLYTTAQKEIFRGANRHGRPSSTEGSQCDKQKDKEDLEEVSSELELADEDELVPYRIGDAFMNLPLEDAQTMLTAASARIDTEVEALEKRLEDVREEMGKLKVALYARFGRSINLET
jgi:prefoldin subunit 4